jgi:thioesterase domain-containing protein
LLTALVRQARAASLVPAEAAEADFRRQVRLYRAHARAAQEHVPPPYPGRVVLFRATAGRAGGPGPLGWERLAAGVDLRPVPGTHDTMLREPHVRALAARLADCLSAEEARCR